MEQSTLNQESTLQAAPRNGNGQHQPLEKTSRHEPQTPLASSGRLYRWERRLMEKLLAMLGKPPVTMQFWNGDSIESPTSPIARMLIRDHLTLWKLLTNTLFEFGEAYTNGRVEIEGDLIGFLTSLDSAGEPGKGQQRWQQRILNWWNRPAGTSQQQSKDNIHTHYDLGNDFYRLWLDEQMLYTCAYFPTPETSLEEAQSAKMDHVCRKLRLEPGEEVIEAGCGWGALALHMAKHYGVKVRAFNISREQISFARQQADELGMRDRVEYIEDDWRNMQGRCDKFVSVGMLEHVGLKNYRQLGQVINRLLKPDGLGLIHSIGMNWSRPFNPWVERRIFPGAYPPTLKEMMDIFERRDFSVLDVENIRLHYAQTLRHWYRRYEEAEETVLAMFDEKFVRAWRLYLAGSTAAFESGRLQLFQVLFTHGRNNAVPRTREYQYNNRSTSAADLFEPS